MKTTPLNESIDSIRSELSSARDSLACAMGVFLKNDYGQRNDLTDANTHLNNIESLVEDIEERLEEIAEEFGS